MNPNDNVCLAFLLGYHLLMWNNHTAKSLPCINTKQTVAKVTLKDQRWNGLPPQTASQCAKLGIEQSS